MKKVIAAKFLAKIFVGCALGSTLAHAADVVPVLFGKNDWLFTPYEFASPADASDTQATLQLLEKANKLFERKGIALALVLVPSKIRIHSEQLPDNKPLDSYTAEKYDNVYKTMRAAGVSVVNLNSAFLSSPQRTSDTPLFFRLDTHWSPTGAFLAAETVKAEIEGNPTLKAALAATPEEKYMLTWNKQKNVTRARDLVKYLPAGSASFPPEQTLSFKVARVQASQASLLSAGENVG
ncbi:MAG: alginate O-acetyltransferase AlgX-related protein, partial [Rhodoferax sp.]